MGGDQCVASQTLVLALNKILSLLEFASKHLNYFSFPMWLDIQYRVNILKCL